MITNAFSRELQSIAKLRHAFVARHWSDVHRYFRRRLRNSADVDDLVQEVCIRFLLADDAVWPRKPLAYLYGIAANLLVDHRRGVTRHGAHILVDSEAVQAVLETESAGASAENDVLRHQLATALMKLPHTHRAVLLAHKRDGFSYAETAVRLNLSIHTVEKYVTQAKAQLRAMRWD